MQVRWRGTRVPAVPLARLRLREGEHHQLRRHLSCGDVERRRGAAAILAPAHHANTAPSGPVHEMQILNVARAHITMGSEVQHPVGHFAAVENDPSHTEGTSMLFGDTKDSPSKLVGEVKGL